LGTEKMKKKIYKITGMNCASCASMIELDLEDAGIKAKCSYPNSRLEVEGTHDPKKVVETIKKSGYSISLD
jgi:copper chaperone CopZ